MLRLWNRANAHTQLKGHKGKKVKKVGRQKGKKKGKSTKG
jgi:hypothetical protein